MSKKILLHACCAPCSAYVIQELKKQGFNSSLFFCNPNIYPYDEYLKRMQELKKYCQKEKINFIEDKQTTHSQWLKKIIKYGQEKEGGLRCLECFKFRLARTAELAEKHNCKYFASTLSISPHKNSEQINQIGEKLAQEKKLNFVAQNWKKQDGFKKSCQISNKENFYRQNYCGCEFSMPKNI